jgi:hypothetical protein
MPTWCPQNVPVPMAKYDPDPEAMYQEECDCLQIYSNKLNGLLWATRQVGPCSLPFFGFMRLAILSSYSLTLPNLCIVQTYH